MQVEHGMFIDTVLDQSGAFLLLGIEYNFLPHSRALAEKTLMIWRVVALRR